MIGFPFCQTLWSQAILKTFSKLGLRHVVVSPGSRSTPLVCALSQCPELVVDHVVDERSAAFLALGHAKVSGEPSLLICTSGTAAAHYFPAIIEAEQSQTPLIVLSADRPPELHGVRAPQTTDQVGLYGSKVRHFVDLGPAEAEFAALKGLVRQVAQSFVLSKAPLAGPVHLNFRARKPLEPATAASSAETQLQEQLQDLLERPLPRAASGVRSVPPALVDDVTRLFAGAQRPAIALGPSERISPALSEALERFARTTGWPLVAEGTSQYRWSVPREVQFDAFDWVLRKRPQFAPDAIIQIGAPLTSTAFNTATQSAAKVVVGQGPWPSADNNVALVTDAEPALLLDALAPKLRLAPELWKQSVFKANRAAWQTLKQILDACSELNELNAVRALGNSLLPQDLLCVGNSLAVRLIDSVIEASTIHLRCSSQRGVNGIDGLLASALGAAKAHVGHTWLLLGDVSFLHDVGSLQLLAQNQQKLTVVVLNNTGGRIFDQLPVAQHLSQHQLTAWTTPHAFKIAQLAQAFGVDAQEVNGLESLRRALSLARSASETQLLEVKLSPHGAHKSYEQLTQAVGSTLDES